MTAIFFIHLIASIFTTAGVLFVAIQSIGLIRNPLNALIGLDQWAAANLLPGAYPDETISAWAHRTHRKRTERFINFLFQDENHCAMAYVSEMRGIHTADEYRRSEMLNQS